MHSASQTALKIYLEKSISEIEKNLLLAAVNLHLLMTNIFWINYTVFL